MRSAPKGGAAYGIPRNAATPWSRRPRSRPLATRTTGALSVSFVIAPPAARSPRGPLSGAVPDVERRKLRAGVS
ncbi:hypothetical protein GCM10027161_37010 [Microbispora hainanensis]